MPIVRPKESGSRRWLYLKQQAYAESADRRQCAHAHLSVHGGQPGKQYVVDVHLYGYAGGGGRRGGLGPAMCERLAGGGRLKLVSEASLIVKSAVR